MELWLSCYLVQLITTPSTRQPQRHDPHHDCCIRVMADCLEMSHPEQKAHCRAWWQMFYWLKHQQLCKMMNSKPHIIIIIKFNIKTNDCCITGFIKFTLVMCCPYINQALSKLYLMRLNMSLHASLWWQTSVIWANSSITPESPLTWKYPASCHTADRPDISFVTTEG